MKKHVTVLLTCLAYSIMASDKLSLFSPSSNAPTPMTLSTPSPNDLSTSSWTFSPGAIQRIEDRYKERAASMVQTTLHTTIEGLKKDNQNLEKTAQRLEQALTTEKRLTSSLQTKLMNAHAKCVALNFQVTQQKEQIQLLTETNTSLELQLEQATQHNKSTSHSRHTSSGTASPLSTGTQDSLNFTLSPISSRASSPRKASPPSHARVLSGSLTSVSEDDDEEVVYC